MIRHKKGVLGNKFSEKSIEYPPCRFGKDLGESLYDALFIRKVFHVLVAMTKIKVKSYLREKIHCTL